MESESQSFPQQLVQLWTKLNASEKLIIISSVLILVIAMVIWISVTRQPATALLYGNLEPSDAGNVVSQLQSKNIQYQIKDGGSSIHVPADKVNELRIALAADGFTPTGTTGYEILEVSPFGMSDRLQRTRTTQALEGELARTLMSLREVSAARVHLTLPQQTPFISERTESVASVVLNIIPPGATLSRENIGAVRTFVAGAISTGPDNVTIIDQNMNLLTGPSLSETGGLMPSQEEARRSYEIQRAADIRSILEPVYGFGKVAVSFSCEMDFDQVQSESVTYEPLSGSDHGILVSEERTEDSTSGEGYTAPVGIPGTESNVPSYIGTTGQPYKSDSASETKNYEVSTTHETRVQSPGTIRNCSVGVVIDSGEISEEDRGTGEITEVRELVAAAAGLDTVRGDIISVAFRPFDTSLAEEMAAQKAELNSQAIWGTVGQIAIALVVIFIFFIVLKQFFKPMTGTLVLAGATEAGEIAEIELPEADPETIEKLRIREEIERLIKEDPESASKVIKTWLKE